MGVPASDQEHSSPTATTNIGRQPTESRVGRYRILSELGRGGTANVYLAVARGQGGVSKLVVLKALLPEFANDPNALAMFLDEARLAAQLNHANVVQTYEIGTEGERSVIVMEYMEGQSLSRILRYAERTGQPLSDAMQLRILVQVLEGLHYAHELRSYDGSPLWLVHRDVSPQNVFVTYDGQVKVLDFGIAKASTSSSPAMPGLIKGKIAYMAPEQMVGEAVDRRADVFSVGCMLWAVAAHGKLWKDVPDVHVVRRVTRGEMPSPKTVNPACDDELERITMKALAFHPDDRYSSARDMQEDLESYVEQLGPATTQRELGRFVSQMFASARSELRASIEQQLASLALEESVVSTEYPIIESRVKSETSQLRPIDESRKPKRRAWLMLPVGLAVLGGLGAWVFARSAREPTTTTSVMASHGAQSLSVAAAPPVKSAPKTTTIYWGVTPANASVFLDGRKLAPGVVSEVVPLDGQVHRLRVETPGRPTSEREFVLPSDGDLNLATEKSSARPQKPLPSVVVPRFRAPAVGAPAAGPAAAAASMPPAPGARAATREEAPRPAAAAACDNPFFLDANGIKRLRPECL